MDKINLGLAHIGVYVKDIEASKNFYCGKLDFTVVFESAIEKAQGQTRIAFVRAGDCVIELVQPASDKTRADGLIDHIAFNVKDIEAAVLKLKAKGIAFESEDVKELPGFFSGGLRYIMFRGPDNEHLELNETLQ